MGHFMTIPNHNQHIIWFRNVRKHFFQIDAKTGKTLSYNDICNCVESVANLLNSEGILPGSVIAICSENCLEYVSVVLGILKIAAIAAPYSPALSSSKINCYDLTYNNS